MADATPPLWPPPQRCDLDARARTGKLSASEVSIGPCELPPQGYRITIDADELRIVASDDAGARYARVTLDQLSVAHEGRLPHGVIEDWPVLETRGVMLDVARCRVPTVETLNALIDRLAGLKMNHLELYMEHTFAYEGHEAVWRDASPYTADDMRTLDAHAAGAGVELTANQNCLGHMERWLAHDRYRPLALAPGGFETRWGHRPPMTMDPANPAALAHVRELLRQLLPTVGSRRVHVGLDEPWELPDARAGEWATYLTALRAAPETADHELLVWADVLASHPDLVAAVPEGVTLCEWGYEADHPFEDRVAPLAAAGVPFWCAPGTSSWNSVGGRWTNAIDNIASAARAATGHGACGLLVTDWGDNGHLQHLAISEPMFAWAAACGWNPAAAAPADASRAASAWMFTDRTGTLGEAVERIGNAHRRVQPQLVNQSILTAQLYKPDVCLGSSRRTTGLTDDDLQSARADLDEGVTLASRSRGDRVDHATLVDEVRAAATLLSVLVDDARARLAGDGTPHAMPRATRAALAGRVGDVIVEHRRLWALRNRAGGLTESVAVLERLLDSYER